MKKFLQKYSKYIPNLIARGIKNFGFISIGISIAVLIEISLYWELIALLAMSLTITALSYLMIKQTVEQLKDKLEEAEV